jgi:outer membrane immunogenic protein
MGRRSLCLLPVVLAFAASAATVAHAADLPVAPAKAPSYYAPPPPAEYNWSGIYFGGHIGGGIARDNVTDTTATAVGAVPFLAAGTVTNVNPASIVGGAQAGFNLQLGPAVIGAEGTWTSSALTNNQATATLIPATQEESRSAPHWYATATGKLGFAIHDWLLYAKGGGAWMHVDYTQITLIPGGLGAQQLITDNRTGWTAGAGVEYALNENLSAKLEYDYLDFGTKNYSFNNLPAPGPGVLPVSIKSQAHLLLFGMNYRFYFGGFGP